MTGGAPAATWRCRWCRGTTGSVVLDLGAQPAADVFPPAGSTGPDVLHPLRMVLCGGCGLAQLEDDPTDADEPRGVEPAALVEQSRAAVADLVDAGLATPGALAAECPSPHGGSWLGVLAGHGLRVAPPEADPPAGTVDVLVDSLGMMHDADQRAALERRAALLAPEGVLALHVHPLGTILRTGAWNALRHGHFAYYSVTWLVAAARAVGLAPVGLWHHGLYGGTVVLVLARDGSRRVADATGTPARAAVEAALADEARAGVVDGARVGTLQADVTRTAAALAGWVRDHRDDGVVGYGAASRAVALLAVAGVTGADLRGVVDASPAKRGLSMPGTAGPDGVRVPVLDPAALGDLHPRWVLLFVPDLLDEVRAAHPEVEAAGGRWVVAEPAPAVADPVPLSPR
ncbi:putative zinc binding protein [Isoptericola jiangsuensis]|uniref:Putative zinc binding protein n=1 Tax=Isoptericola jiangsuensis TaxID=548579 RepID=A0A2A9F101_9MICO|nr:class I SAM-dependent methyltransferase [Isoptericola jiangsuensis]PFG44222.1 putative zinc binding protein [Isoptericola jiangsuensis]